MARRFYKCFVCGKNYKTEEEAHKCHNAPIQRVLRQEGKKPRFLGN
ncbi:MAG TPA: hypothetical protein VGB78_05840 [Thermoplasmata archaeon]